MAAVFDAYHRWLGIAPEEQPPDHYRLLGLKVFEGDADVIESAADRQMTHVRSFQSGEHADHAERVLNEISAAKLTLLDVGKKAAYDSQLRAKKAHARRKQQDERKLQVAQPLAASPNLPPPSQPVVEQVAPPAASESFAAQPVIHADARRKKSGMSTVLYGAIACVLALLLVGGAIAMLARPWETTPQVAGGTEVGNGENIGNIAHEENSNTNPPPPPPPPLIPQDGGDAGDADAVEQPNETPVDGVDEPPADDEDDPNATPNGGESVEAAADQAPAAATTKESVPDKPSRDAARAKIAGIFPLDDADTPAQKAALAAQLLDVARDTENDAVARFVLLNLARENAAGAGQARQAMAAVDMLEAGYDFDVGPVRLATLGAAVKAPLPPNQKRDTVIVGIEMMDAMMARDEYQAAGKLVEPLVDIARRVKEKALLDALAQRRQRASELYSAYRKAQTAIETLKDDPDNEDANLAAGRFYLFAKGNWSRALPLLAKSSNAKLAAAAQGEIQKPSTTAQEEKLADAWWEIAAAETDEDAQHLLKARSMAWYRRAVGELTGLSKAKAQNRIQQLADAGIRPGDLAADLGFFSRPPSGLGTYPLDKPTTGRVVLPQNLVDAIDVTAHTRGGEWARTNDGLVCKGKGFLTLPVTCKATNYEIAINLARDGYGAIGIVLPVELNYVSAFLSVRHKPEPNHPSYGGFADIEGKNLWRNSTRIKHPHIHDGKWHQVNCRVVVERGVVHLSLVLDGRVVQTWRGPSSSIAAGRIVNSPQGWAPTVNQHLAIYTEGGTAMYKAIAVKPYVGRLELDTKPDAEATSSTDSDEKDLGIFSRDPAELRPARQPEDGLLAHWTFDEGRGNVARDAVGGHHGTIKGATWTKGVRGGALSFDGQDDIVVIGNPGALNFEGEIAIAAWVRSHSLPATNSGAIRNVVCHGFTLSPNRSVVIRQLSRRGQARIQYESGSWFGGRESFAGINIPADDLRSWVHLASVYDGKAWKLFHNGRNVASHESPVGSVIVPGSWAIGGHAGDKPRIFHGDIDDVRIYNRALAAEEVAALAKAEP